MAKGLTGAQGKCGRIPVAGTGKAEDAGREGGGEAGGFDHDAAAPVLFPGQEGDVEAAPEQARIARPRRIEQRARLIQRAEVQQFVDAGGQKLGGGAGIGGGIGFGKQKRQQQAAQGGQGFDAFGGDELRDLGAASRTPERCGQSRDLWRQQADRIRGGRADHRYRYVFLHDARCHRGLLRIDGGGCGCGDGLGQPVDGGQRFLGAQRCRRKRREDDQKGARPLNPHSASPEPSPRPGRG